MMPGPDWRDYAACRDVDPDLFFPVGTSDPAQVQTECAKAVCAGCSVVTECLAWAVTWLPDGVAGGLTATERARERRGRAPVSTATVASRERRETAGLLRARGWPPAAIARQLGVNERSVYRLLKSVA